MMQRFLDSHQFKNLIKPKLFGCNVECSWRSCIAILYRVNRHGWEYIRATRIKSHPKMDEAAIEDATPEVFGNKVVLREVFKYLPTSTLLSSCSLVNKLWREEACAFIRDKRECTVNLGLDISADSDRPANLWKQMCELDRVLEKMATIPFNSLRVHVTNSNIDCDEEEVDMNALTDFITRFPLKYLSVFEDAESRGLCTFPAASAILQLVQENASKLLELESRTGRSEKNCGVFKEWVPPRFENLKKLSIAKNSSITKYCGKKIIRGASNLRSIHNNFLHMIPDVIPEKMYGALKRLSFGVKDVPHIEKFADKLDHLEELVVDFECFEVESELKIRCVALFQKLLALNMTTLCSLGIKSHKDVNLFNQLQLPMLPNVKVLFISDWRFRHVDDILQLNFRGSLPNLCKVYISNDGRLTSSLSIQHVGAVMVPDDEDVMVSSNASETTLELAIDGNSIDPSNLLTLRRLFPNLIRLSVGHRHFVPPLGLIGSLWPNLQCLSISNRSILGDDVGAEVFGLHSQEWELLQQRDKEFLKRVQLAPSRPCVWTMKELKNFQLEYQDSHYLRESETFRKFLETLAIGRMSGLSFKVKQNLTELCWRTARFKDLVEEYRPFLQPFMMIS